MRIWLALGVAGAVLAGTAIARAPADVGILVVDATTGARQRITSIDGRAVFARDGGAIYVSGEVDLADGRAVQTFAVFDPNGRRVLRRVLHVPEIAGGEVAVSPDGRRIAYLRAPRDASEVNTGDLVVEPFDGRGRAQRRLVRASGTPAWSPDGRRIAVAQLSVDEAHGDLGAGPSPIRIVVVGADRPRVPGTGLDPRWLPDGRLLVLARARRLSHLVVMRADGRDRYIALRDVRTGETSWDLSPDGRLLAVAAAGQGSPKYHLTLVALSTGATRRLSDEPTSDVRWSPDGKSLAVIVGERILLLDPSGVAAPRELTRLPKRDLRALAWSPDGRRLLVTAEVHRPYRD